MTERERENANVPIPMAARFNASVCSRSLPRIVGLNPAGAMDVCCEFCVVSGRGLLGRADHSSRGVLPSVVCLSMIVKPR